MSDKTDKEDTGQTEPSSDPVVPDQTVQSPPMGEVGGSPVEGATQEDEYVGKSGDVPVATDERSPGSEGQVSAPTASTEGLKKAGDESEAPPSTLPTLSDGGREEGEGSGSTADGPRTGTQHSSSASRGPERMSGGGAEGGAEESATDPSPGHQLGGEGEVVGEGTEVQETAGGELVQSAEKKKEVEGTYHLDGGSDKGNEPSLGKVGGEKEEEEEKDDEEPAPGGTEAGDSDGLVVGKGAVGRQDSPRDGKEDGAEGRGEGGAEGGSEENESKAALATEQGERGEAVQSAETGPVSGETVDQDGLTAVGEESKEGGQKEKVVVEETVLPDGFFYDYDSLVSKPEVVDLLPSALSLQYPPSQSVCVCVRACMYVPCPPPPPPPPPPPRGPP